MSGPGWNEPCPRGSGKKCRRGCPLATAQVIRAYTAAERRGAQIALGEFGWRHELGFSRVPWPASPAEPASIRRSPTALTSVGRTTAPGRRAGEPA